MYNDINMELDTLSYNLISIIILLSSLVFVSWANVRRLKKLINEERKKRDVPILTFQRDDNNQTFLINDGNCHAKDIKIVDLIMTIEVGFEKTLHLKFDPIEMIKPQQKHLLHYRVFDRQYDITSKSSPTLLNLYADEKVEVQIEYQNLKGVTFISTIGFSNNKFFLKTILPKKTLQTKE